MLCVILSVLSMTQALWDVGVVFGQWGLFHRAAVCWCLCVRVYVCCTVGLAFAACCADSTH